MKKPPFTGKYRVIVFEYATVAVILPQIVISMNAFHHLDIKFVWSICSIGDSNKTNPSKA